MFEISIKQYIKAEREFVFDWWTDFSPEDTTLVKPLKSRRIVSKTPDLILLRDEEEMYFKRMVFDVKVTLKRPERWTSEYEGKDASARSEYILRSNEDSTTTLFYHTRIGPKGSFTKLFSPIINPFVRRIFVAEMRIFAQRLEEDYVKKQRIA
jgi:hypothetical protein